MHIPLVCMLSLPLNPHMCFFSSLVSYFPSPCALSLTLPLPCTPFSPLLSYTCEPCLFIPHVLLAMHPLAHSSCALTLSCALLPIPCAQPHLSCAFLSLPWEEHPLSYLLEASRQYSVFDFSNKTHTFYLILSFFYNLASSSLCEDRHCTDSCVCFLLCNQPFDKTLIKNCCACIKLLNIFGIVI
jgi:hypothetical protein